MVSREHERDLLPADDPLRDGASLATRPLTIDEVDRIKGVLHDAGIGHRVRLVREGTVEGPRRDPLLLSEYSVLRPSWNVIVAPADLAKARALVETALRRDVDGRDDTQALAGNEPGSGPSPVPLCILPWEEAWAAVERLGHGGIKAAVGAPLGDGPLEERDCAVLVLPEDLAKARAWMPELPPLEGS
jgi:hypothetical protein